MNLIWRLIWVGAFVVSGIVYALPNLYSNTPALVVRGVDDNINSLRIQSILHQLDLERLPIQDWRHQDDSLLILFEDTTAQTRAFEYLKEVTYGQYTVGYTLASMAPDWLRSVNAHPLSLGLDLLGGVHFLLEISGQELERSLYEGFSASIQELALENDLNIVEIKQGEGGIRLTTASPESLESLLDLIDQRESEIRCRKSPAGSERYNAKCELTEESLRDLNNNTIRQNMSSLRKRVDELGVAEPIIQRNGDRRIIVQLPGVQDPARARDILGSTASVEFRMVHGTHSQVSTRRYLQRGGGSIGLENRVIVGGEHIVNATAGVDTETGGPVVNIRLNEGGAQRMSKNTSENVGNPMAVVYKETEFIDLDNRESRITEEVINVATIREPFGFRFQISGLELQESRDLALLLRAGALKAPMVIIEERSVGPTLGKLNVEQGLNSVMLALALVMLFMLVYYRYFGLIANIALFVNSSMIIAVLSLLQATLTLPGIAGIVLTIGMSVDANTLVFERIREEARQGSNSIHECISRGYSKALGTITDSNLTTFFSAIVLFAVSTGSVRGFAITLAIGIATSMFTALVLSRLLTDIGYRVLGIKKLYL